MGKDIRVCKYCKESIEHRRKNITRCSSDACRKAANNERKKRFYDKKKEELGYRYEDQYKPPRIDQICQVCGASFKRRNIVRTCSHTCQRVLVKIERLERVRAERMLYTAICCRKDNALLKLKKASKGTRGKRIWHQGSCSRCDSIFLGRPKAQYCSKSCKNGDVQDKRRAMKQGALFTKASRMQIFIRDSYICQLCNEPTSKSYDKHDPKSPTIDHIKPLSKGGSHTIDNLQTAHSICNSYKSDSY